MYARIHLTTIHMTDSWAYIVAETYIKEETGENVIK